MADVQPPHPAAPVESMVLYDHYKPGIAGGVYRFILQQTVDAGTDAKGTPDIHHYYHDQTFEVVAPRHAIDQGEFQAFFPPSAGFGDYRQTLPHVVLRTRDLPWLRELDGTTPWLALLVLSDQEIGDGKVEEVAGTAADLQPLSGSRVRTPDLATADDEKTPVRWLEMDRALFLNLCPRLGELRYLAHVRHVDHGDKVPADMPAQGEFSVLVANRMPAAGTNTVHLISLEGWRDVLTGPPGQIGERVRLITLGRWSFVNDSARPDTFAGLMDQLGEQARVFGARAAPMPNSIVGKALVLGYTPVDYRPLDSTPNFAWYRGPLAAAHRPTIRSHEPFRNPDAALVFDEATGVMDVSYASAWQLGRLSGLAAPAFAKGLRTFVEQTHQAAETARQIADFLSLHASILDQPPTGGAAAPEIVKAANDLVSWLARLALLYPVPFQYLVPDPDLLPPESIRFFCIDDTWVEALIDGALSIAVRNGADREALYRKDTSRQEMRSAMSTIVYEYRTRLLGRTPNWTAAPDYMAERKTGFLMRSKIVSDWPGVEIKAVTDAPELGNMPGVLRMDQIADGVLFCLARGTIQSVTFNEPREGLTFGVADGVPMRGQPEKGVLDIATLASNLELGIGPAKFAAHMIRRPAAKTIVWGALEGNGNAGR